jgi:hypothetical protein
MPWRADSKPGRGAGVPGDPGVVTCGRVREWIDPFLESDLARPQTEALEAHLEGCPDCRSELAMARRLRDAMREGLPMLTCPPEVTAEVLRIAREEAAGAPAAERPGRRSGPGLAARLAAWLGGGGSLRPALVAAALVLLLLAAPLLYRAVVPSAPEAPPTVADAPDAPGAPYSAAEVAEAEEQARLVLAYVASVGRDAGRAVQEDVFDTGLARPTRRVVEGLQAAGLARSAAGRDSAERNQP